MYMNNMKKKKLLIICILVIALIIIGVFIFKRTSIKTNSNSTKTKFYTGQKGESDIDTIWCGTFQLAWNELIEYVGGKVELDGVNSELVNKLNEQKFTKEMLSEGDYYVKAGKTSPELKNEMIREIENKFGKDRTSLLNGLNFEASNGVTIYSNLDKKFTFLEEFDPINNKTYGNSEKIIKAFGITKRE